MNRRGVLILSLAVAWCGLGSVAPAAAQTTLRKSYNDGAKKAVEEARYADAEIAQKRIHPLPNQTSRSSSQKTRSHFFTSQRSSDCCFSTT
jgi:hypothetical protein